MFSRILATESVAVPATRRACSARRTAATRPSTTQPPVHLDHARDVAPVAVAEVVEDLVVDRVELLAELLDLLVGEPRQRALDHRWPWGPRVSGSWFTARSRRAPSGALTQVRTISPSRARRPCRCAGRGPGPSTACRRRCGRCPCGSRRAASRPASSPATRIGVRAVARRASTSLFRKLDRAALAALGVAEPMIGWKRSMCRRVASRPRAPSARRGRRASRPGRRRTSRARASRGRARRGRGGSMRPVARR